MKKIGRNDPCPSGTGKKFKKCLAVHPSLYVQSSAAAVWWVCDRWQTQAPSLPELRTALTDMPEVCPEKTDRFLEMAFATPSPAASFWRELIMQLRAKRHPDLPGLFRRISAHLAATANPELPWLCSSAATCLREDRPEMFPEVLAATLALDPATTPMQSLEVLVEWAVDLERPDACELLRERFPEFPEYMLVEPEEEAAAAEPDDDRNAPEPEFPPEVTAALNKVWEDFDALDPPSFEQAEAFVEELLALPHEATEWNEVFQAAKRCGHADSFRIFHRLAAALAPTQHRDFAFVCWAAVEEASRRKTPERLPEIARTLLDFNSHACDPDALSHIADALLRHGYVNETIELMIGFLPSLRDNGDVLSWVVPHVTNEIFLLRLGCLIVSGDYSRQPIDHLLAALRAGMEDEICGKKASVPLRYLMLKGEVFSREQFMVPGSTKDRGEQELLWNVLQQAFVEVARDGWQSENRNPSTTLIGLHMVLRSVQDWIVSPREKGRKYPPNLLDYLNYSALNRLVATECRDLLGINLERARIMLDACVTLIRWTGRHGLLAESDAAKAENDMARLM